ncbi:MAG: universal stress protein [Smithella sp.]
MFNRILVPTDFSKKHISSLDIAVNLAEKYKSTVHLFHVIEIIPEMSFKEFEAFYNKLEKKAEDNMNALISSYKNKSFRFVQNIEYGNRTKEILKFIKQNEINLVIMNSHKVKIANPVQDWGTISYQVSLLTKIPIMLVK